MANKLGKLIEKLCLGTSVTKADVVTGIEALPERQKLVLSFYYYEDLTMAEIGNILEVSEARISKLHGDAIKTLQGRFKETA